MRQEVVISCRQMQQVLAECRGVLDEAGLELVVPELGFSAPRRGRALTAPAGLCRDHPGDDRLTERVIAGSPSLRAISKWVPSTSASPRNGE